MTFSDVSAFSFYLLSILIQIWIIASVRPYKNRKAVRVLMLFSVLMIGWALCLALTLLPMRTQNAAVFWWKFAYTFSYFTPYTFLALLEAYSSQRRYVGKWLMLILHLLPMLIIIMLWTDPIHHLYFTSHEFIAVQSGWRFNPVLSPLPLNYLMINNLMLLYAAFQFVRNFVQMPPPYRRLAITTSVLMVLPIGYMIMIVSDSMQSPYDFVPPMITISMAAFSLFITRHQIFELEPISRIMFFEEFSNGAIVLDPAGRILDINKAAVALINPGQSDTLIGRNALDYFPDWRETIAHIASVPHNPERKHAEHVIPFVQGDLHYDTQLKPYYNNEKQLSCVLVIFHDVSMYTNLLQKINDVAMKDPLTGIMNRRQFEILFEDHLKLARRYLRPCGLILLDLDNFKEVNDTFGHSVGDETLIQLTKMIQSRLRESDVFARIGGDEFLIFFPETNEQGMMQIITTLWDLVTGVQFTVDQHHVPLSCSIGVSLMEHNWSITPRELIDRADQAMYHAKQSKSTIGVWTDDEIRCVSIEEISRSERVS
ncbi:MAG: diguanylate cyclase [Anaerolineaceae bacterium]|nr:diguanylate cyclase [Anaerolineaceae bacterium]